ncbi:MAG: AAA family ATPase, partial [Cyanobacteria bacterium J06648_1]
MAIKRSSDSQPTPQQPRKPTTPKRNYEVTLLSPQVTTQETETNEEKVRPQKLADYIGQKKLKGILNMAIAAAKGREDPLDHLLLYGPPGLGKTTMSLILAAEMGVDCKITSAPALERPRDITGLLVSLKPGDIIFIDEILRHAIETVD